MTGEQLAALILFALVTVLTPGPNNLMVLASGVNFGFARTLPHMLGITLGFVAMQVIVGAGLGQILTTNATVYAALKYASALYMLWLAWQIATAGPMTRDGAVARTRALTFIEAAAFQWINPKAWTIALAATAAYTLPDAYTWSLAIICLVIGVVTLPCVAAWTLFGVGLSGWLGDGWRVRAFNIAMALALVASLWPIAAEFFAR